jgi:hypothetical protein
VDGSAQAQPRGFGDGDDGRRQENAGEAPPAAAQGVGPEQLGQEPTPAADVHRRRQEQAAVGGGHEQDAEETRHEETTEEEREGPVQAPPDVRQLPGRGLERLDRGAARVRRLLLRGGVRLPHARSHEHHQPRNRPESDQLGGPVQGAETVLRPDAALLHVDAVRRQRQQRHPQELQGDGGGGVRLPIMATGTRSRHICDREGGRGGAVSFSVCDLEDSPSRASAPVKNHRFCDVPDRGPGGRSTPVVVPLRRVGFFPRSSSVIVILIQCKTTVPFVLLYNLHPFIHETLVLLLNC